MFGSSKPPGYGTSGFGLPQLAGDPDLQSCSHDLKLLKVSAPTPELALPVLPEYKEVSEKPTKSLRGGSSCHAMVRVVVRLLVFRVL